MGNKPIVHAPIATGSTEPRDIRDRFADWCNVKDFGAKGDGLTDDSSAFLAAHASGAPAIMVPEGSYYITEDIPGIFYSFGEVEKTGIGNVTIINLLANGSVPVGTVLWLSTATVPAGFLLCNGQAIARDTYPDLFSAIGTTYGAGDGSTTFNLPNLIDKFIEGASTNIGDSVAAGLPNITGEQNFRLNTMHGGYSGALYREDRGTNFSPATAGSGLTAYSTLRLDASKSNSIYGNSNTVQPPAVKLLPCIKAYSDVDNLGSLDVAQLENYVQNSVVHLTGDESITGVKHFTSTAQGTLNYSIAIHIPSYTAGQIPQQDATNGITFRDGSESATPVGDIHHGISTSGTRGLHFHLYALSSEDSLTGFSVMATTYDKRFAPTGAGEMYLGVSANRWKTIYSVNALNTSSDERIKTFIAKIPDAVLDAWEEVGFVQYKLKSSIEKKGENARLHNGLVAQRIDSVFKAHGIDVSQYGLFCHDSWESSPAEYDSNGNLVNEAKDAGDEFSLRYEEALCMEAAYQRRRADRAEARIASLEERLAALEAKLEQ